MFRKKSKNGLDMETDDQTKEEVSLVLVQVKNRSQDSGFSKSATTKLCPSFVFKPKKKRAQNQPTVENHEAVDKNPLRAKTARDVIRIYMNVQDEGNKHYRFIYGDDEHGFTLCYRSVSTKTFPFFNDDVATRWADLAGPVWDPMILVQGDLKYRNEMEINIKPKLSEVMPDENAKKIASRAFEDPPGRSVAEVLGSDEEDCDYVQEENYDEESDEESDEEVNVPRYRTRSQKRPRVQRRDSHKQPRM